MAIPEDRYRSKWKSIVNVMKSSSLKVSRITISGSRARKKHRPDSDLDIIFAVAGNPSKGDFYSKLINVLKKNFPNEKAYPGSTYNVVHMDFIGGGKFDLALLTEDNFDKQHGKDVEYRRNNL